MSIPPGWSLAAAYICAGSGGVMLTMMYLAWPHRAPNMWAFVLLGSGACLLISVVSESFAPLLGVSMVVPPLVLIQLTAASGDGLGGGVLSAIVALSWFPFVVAAIFGGRWHYRSVTVPGWPGRVNEVVVGIALVGMAGVLWLRWPRPFEGIALAIGQIQEPAGFELLSEERAGHQLRLSDGGPLIVRTYRTAGERTRACSMLRRALTDAGISPLRMPEGLPKCTFDGRIRGGPFGSFGVRAGPVVDGGPGEYFVSVGCGC